MGLEDDFSAKNGPKNHVQKCFIYYCWILLFMKNIFVSLLSLILFVEMLCIEFDLRICILYIYIIFVFSLKWIGFRPR